MYKMYIFLRANDEESIKIFSTKTVDIVKELKTEFQLGNIEGSALTEEKFSRVIEIVTENINEMNKLMASSQGKNLTRHLSGNISSITIFFAEFKD